MDRTQTFGGFKILDHCATPANKATNHMMKHNKGLNRIPEKLGVFFPKKRAFPISCQKLLVSFLWDICKFDSGNSVKKHQVLGDSC